MSQSKLDYFRPALIGGAIAGALSGIPVVSAGNCFCCLWIIGGAALAAHLLAKGADSPLKPGDGAVVGALTGVVAAVVESLVSLPFRSFNLELSRQAMDWVSGLGLEMPSGWDSLFDSGAGLFSPAWFFLGLFFSAAVFAVVGVIGGVLGVSLVNRKRAAALPPSGPPGGGVNAS